MFKFLSKNFFERILFFKLLKMIIFLFLIVLFVKIGLRVFFKGDGKLFEDDN